MRRREILAAAPITTVGVLGGCTGDTDNGEPSAEAGGQSAGADSVPGVGAGASLTPYPDSHIAEGFEVGHLAAPTGFGCDSEETGHLVTQGVQEFKFRLTGRIRAPSSCYDVDGSVRYDQQADRAELLVTPVAPSTDDCESECAPLLKYDGTVYVHRSLPAEAVLSHVTPGGEEQQIDSVEPEPEA